MKKVMGSLMECMKPRCLFNNNKKKKEQKRRQQRPVYRDERKEPFLKTDHILTLRDCILSSPRSSPLPATSNKKVYPNPVNVNEEISMERLLFEVHLDAQRNDGDDMETKMNDDSSKGERPKKRVSFRMPEVADVFILADSPKTAHESPYLVQSTNIIEILNS